MMSTDYLRPEHSKEKQKRVFFPGGAADTPWNDVEVNDRYYVSLPFYPFRTLSPRNMATIQAAGKSSSTSASTLTGGGGGGLDFDYASCLIPAHTHTSVILKRRTENLLDFLLPQRLSSIIGSRNAQLTAAERTAALTFVGRVRPAVPAQAAAGNAAAVPAQAAVDVNFEVTSVAVRIDSIVLQVGIFYEGSHLPPPPLPS
jgi:hypothetical protein